MRLKYRRTVDETFVGKNLLNCFPNVLTNVSDAILRGKEYRHL